MAERYAEAAAAHAWVIDNSPAFRLRPGVPDWSQPTRMRRALKPVGPRGLISLPGSASVALATALAPLDAAAQLERAEVATYQAGSEAAAPRWMSSAGETVAMLKAVSRLAAGPSAAKSPST